MWRSYFTNKNYLVFYLHTFGDDVASALTNIFTGVYFYTIGMPLPFILLFWGLEFGLRGVFSPLGPSLFSKIGLAKTILLSYVSMTLYFVLVGLAHISLIVGFSAFMFYSLARALYYPCMDALHAVLVHEESRGRQYSMESVISFVASIVATILGTFILGHYPFWILTIIVGVILAVSGGITIFFDPISDFENKINAADSYRYLVSEKFKTYRFPIAAYSLAIIANIMVVPLFLFIKVGNLNTFGVLIGATFVVQMFVTLLTGAAVDAWKRPRSAPYIAVAQGLGDIAYLLFTQTPFSAFLVNAFNANAWSALRNNFETRISRENKKNGDHLLFAASIQMALCFTEVMALSLFALIAYLWGGTAAFVAIFVSSALGLLVAERYLFGRPEMS